MKIITITLCKNEELFLPFFLRHYSLFSDEIHVWDNQSTDKSVEIIQSNPKCVLKRYDSKGVTDDGLHLEIKNKYYKSLKADWFIIVDMDEIIYHPNLLNLLGYYLCEGVTIPLINGFGMVSYKVPVDDGKSQIYELVKEGMIYPNYGKRAVISGSVNINYDGGCHKCRPTGRVIFSKKAEINLFHYKMLSKEYVIEKAKKCVLSEKNKRMRWGFEGASPEIMAIDWDVHWSNRREIL